ncbi:MAG: hypothetical protein J6J04_04735 [Oscillospiraceae bacterium]|nr:hypothetical protein [Oscillospiraceae bacterium]
MTVENIVLYVILAVILVFGGLYIMGFKDWLVWAVIEAEHMLGSKTGQMKLRYVYDLAIKHFPVVAKLLPFSVFSILVEKALEVMNTMIQDNKSIADAIGVVLVGDETE